MKSTLEDYKKLAAIMVANGSHKDSYLIWLKNVKNLRTITLVQKKRIIELYEEATDGLQA
jgi:hypothetical protein